MSWLVEVVEDSADLWDEGRLVWSVRYVQEGRSHSRNQAENQRKKITTRIEVQKDDIQAVLPISKVNKVIECPYWL